MAETSSRDVFLRDGDGIHHFWGSEILYVPPESGQEYRHNDALDPLWICSTSRPRGAATFIRN